MSYIPSPSHQICNSVHAQLVALGTRIKAQRKALKVTAQTKCWFGGGTAIALKYGEYRESLDIDFLVSNREGYSAMRQPHKYGARHASAHIASTMGLASFASSPCQVHTAQKRRAFYKLTSTLN